jgi:hypothetical protein
LVGISAIFFNDLVIDVLVRAFYIPSVYLPRLPKVTLATFDRFVEIASIAPWVAKAAPKAVRCVLCKEAACHRPDGVVNTAGLVKHDHYAVVVMHTRERVRILSTPQSAL